MTDECETADECVLDAIVAPRRTRWIGLVYAIPVVIAMGLTWMVWDASRDRGPLIHIRFEDGYGLATGDALKYRGIQIGEVEDVRLGDQMDAVHVAVRLRTDAADIAREDSLFWVVRPQVHITGVSGMSALLGPNTIGVLPGSGAPAESFVGVESPPIVEQMNPGGLTIILHARSRSSLVAGSPVHYRKMVVGRIVDVQLASDGTAVEAAAYIEPDYRTLVRQNSRFWNTSGIQLDVGLGIEFSADSLESLLTGGVSLATPDEPGEHVSDGHSFQVFAKPGKEWTSWTPSLRIGEEMDSGQEPGFSIPTLSVSFRAGRYIKRDTSLSGRVMPIAGGMIAPADLLILPKHVDSIRYEWNNQGFAAPSGAVKRGDGPSHALVHFEGKVPGVFLKRDELRSPKIPEDCTVLRGGALPLPISASGIQQKDGRWICRDHRSDRRWHGAWVMADSDQRFIGMIIAGKRQLEIAPLPAGFVDAPP